eukprot:Blabericola_migrator_1__8889@NODE_46_length_16830_cov_132_783392_g42_i0_p5_GENE_NODE_46_length_16830_cov_132_783392_g42_i0NODE_46_length_16830_cov_132_783392_g42_i0_p5_ORF_typecomplete_len407_score75_86Es2/PF09751_9/4_3e25B5/PF03484_15/0_012_NODE_46_length_16830_cov_132_783392_g42_i071668386
MTGEGRQVKRRYVLKEEEYEESLGEIIRRDYYPLVQRQPSEEVEVLDEDGYPVPKQEILARLRVDEFIALHTTAETEEFRKTLENEERNRQQALGWAKEQSEAHNAKQLALKQSLEHYEGVETTGHLIGGQRLRELTEFARDGELLMPSHNTLSSVHFAPTSALTHLTTEQLPALTAESEGELKALQLPSSSTAATRALVSPSNTRFDLQRELDLLADIRTTERLEWQKAESDKAKKLNEALESGHFTPSLGPGILQTPTMIPDDMTEQIFTWGVLASTPIVISEEQESLDVKDSQEAPSVPSNDIPSTAYVIPEMSEREKAASHLHRSVIEKDRMRKRATLAMRSEVRELSTARKRGKDTSIPTALGSLRTPLTGVSIFGGAATAKRVMDTPLARALLQNQRKSC